MNKVMHIAYQDIYGFYILAVIILMEAFDIARHRNRQMICLWWFSPLARFEHHKHIPFLTLVSYYLIFKKFASVIVLIPRAVSLTI